MNNEKHESEGLTNREALAVLFLHPTLLQQQRSNWLAKKTTT